MNDKPTSALSTAALSEMITTLAGASPARDDAERIDRIRHFEELKAAIAAAQARETVAFAASQRALDRPTPTSGIPVRANRVEQSIAHQVALARRCSAAQARRFLTWAQTLTADLPETLAALQAGHTTEWRAALVTREAGGLTREHRAVLDRELAPRLESLGDRTTERNAAAIAYRLDPEGAAEKRRNADRDRRVSLRPAPDTMTRLTGLLPLVQGVAAYAALKSDADTKIAAGDARARGQIMADTLVERLTGQTAAEDVPVTVNLIMTDQALLGRQGTDRDEPAVISGHGPLPASSARQFVLGSKAPVWLRRLYTAPRTRDLVAMDSRRRCFTRSQRDFIALRDQTCRTPWCEAPIRHIDHIKPAEDGGPTSVPNGQGYCEACNHAKQAPGWRTTEVAGPGPHTVETETPTGHRYRSRAPDPPGSSRRRIPFEVRVDWQFHAAA